MPIAVGAFVAGFVCAAGTGWLKDNSRIKEDTAMGVVFSGLFGFGLVLYASVPTTLHLSHLLFGDMLGVTWADVGLGGARRGGRRGGAARRSAPTSSRRSSTPRHARAIGLPVRALHYGLLALVALAVVGALQAVGIILSVALLITPGATAFLWVRRFGPMLALAAALGVARRGDRRLRQLLDRRGPGADHRARRCRRRSRSASPDRSWCSAKSAASTP